MALPINRISTKQWTAVIPAAGRGARLGFDQPKLFYPVCGIPMMTRMLDLIRPICRECVVVVAPDAVEQTQTLLVKHAANDRFQIAVQPEPIGMADAIWRAMPLVQTPNVLITWVDQIGLHPRTISTCARWHAASPTTLLTLPVVRRKNPYIEFVWSKDGKLMEVRQAREGEVIGQEAESDCGLFLVNRKTLIGVLEKSRAEGWARGARTGEWNFLPLLPRFESGPGTVQVWRGANEWESLGVNTPEDARVISRWIADVEAPLHANA